jgi:mannitol-specific phosphotransferase system IIBC component
MLSSIYLKFFTTNNQLNKTKTKTKNENQKTKHKTQKTKNKKQKQKQTKQNKTNSVFIEFFSRKRVVPRIPLSA